MTEFRLQCVATGHIWPRSYPTEKAIISAQGQWNSTATAPAGTMKHARGESVGNTDSHPQVRAVEVEIVVKRVVREAKL